MGQALALADARSAALSSPAPLPVALPERPSVAFPRPQRRAAAAVLAACLVVGVGAGSVAASQAGGPLYGPRMWIEAATLPSDPMARANAQLGRLDARLQEVRVASGNGNAGAAEAALEAYAVIVADLDAQASANSAVAASVEDGMARRQVVLIGLLDEVPAQAQDAIQHALQQGANAIDGTGVDPHPGNPAQGGGGQGGQGQGGRRSAVRAAGYRAGRRWSGHQWPGPGRRIGQRSQPEPHQRHRRRTARRSPRSRPRRRRPIPRRSSSRPRHDHARRRQPERERWLESPGESAAVRRSGRPERRRGRRLIPRRRCTEARRAASWPKYP